MPLSWDERGASVSERGMRGAVWGDAGLQMAVDAPRASAAPCIPRSYRCAHSRPFRRDERGSRSDRRDVSWYAIILDDVCDVSVVSSQRN